MDLLAALRHRRPGRLLRAVRRRDGRDGPHPGHPVAGRRRASCDGTPQPDGRILYTSDDRHAWPEMYFAGVGLGALRADPRLSAPARRPAWTRQAIDAADPSAAPSADHGAEPGAGAEPDAPTARPAPTNGGVSVPWWPVAALRRAGPASASGRASLRRVQRRRRLARAPTRCTWPRAPGPSCAPPPSTSGWTGPSSARRASRRAASWARCPAPSPTRSRSLEGLLVQVERGRYGRGRGRVGHHGRARGALAHGRDRGVVAQGDAAAASTASAAGGVGCGRCRCCAGRRLRPASLSGLVEPVAAQ